MNITPNLVIEEPVIMVMAEGMRRATCEHCSHAIWAPFGSPLGPTGHYCRRDEQACYVVWGRLVSTLQGL